MVTVGVPQSSVAVALPNAASMSAVVGLHPNPKLFPVALRVGTVTSNVQVAVREVVDVLPQASVAVKVLVCEREHPLLCRGPSTEVIDVVPQPSVADADPSALLITAELGLQPSVPLMGVPVALIAGPV